MTLVEKVHAFHSVIAFDIQSNIAVIAGSKRWKFLRKCIQRIGAVCTSRIRIS